MKKFTKVCLITSLILILTGGTICVIGAVSGGWRAVRETERDDSWWKMVGGVANAYHWDWDWGYDYDYYERMESRGQEHDNIAGKSSVIPAGYTDIGITRQDVTEMDISIGGAALYIRESADDNFGVEKDGIGRYRCYVSGGVLYLEGNKKNVITANDEKVYLYVPADADFRQVSIEVGGAMIELGTLKADEIDIEAGAGVVNADKLTCRSLSVDVGAGTVNFKDVETDELDVVVGVGHAYVEGNVKSEIDVECGMGVVELRLAGAEEDYNYEIDCAAGSVRVGNRTYSVLAEDSYTNNNAMAECYLECAMGSIQVSFHNSL